MEYPSFESYNGHLDVESQEISWVQTTGKYNLNAGPGFPAESQQNPPISQITLLILVHERLLIHLETTYARNQLGLILLIK